MTIVIFILIFLSFLCYIADISEGAEVSVMTFITIIDIGIGAAMGLLPDTLNCRLRMRRECRERFPPPPISKETAS